MKTKKLNAILSKFTLILLSLVLVFSLCACAGKTLPSPEVKNVTLSAETGYAVGEIGITHTLSYSATEGSTVEVSLKKGAQAATSADCTYTASTKTLVFSQEGSYTVTVKATMNGVSDEESVTVTAIAPAPVLTDVSVQAKSGALYGRTGQEHVVSYTLSAGSEAGVSVRKDNAAAQEADYTYAEATKTITFNNEGEYEIIVTATKNAQQVQKIVLVSVYDIEAPTFTQAASIAAKTGEEAGRVDSVHVLSYTVTADSETVSVKKDGELALSGTDYTYDDSTKEITFLTTGAYEVIVSATTAGKTSKSIAAIEIVSMAAPVVSGMLLTPSQYGYFRGQELGLSYQVNVPNNAYPVGDCVTAVSVQKGTLDDGEYTYEDMTEGEGYTYDSASKKLTFAAIGNYKVIVSSSAHGATGTAFVTVDVRDFAKPAFTFTLSSEEVEEGGTVTVTTSDITYDVGDGAAAGGAHLQYSVRYKVRDNASWAVSSGDDGKWTMTESGFTANLAGYYEVTAYVESAQGTIGRQIAILHAAPKEITVTPSANYTGEWMHVAKNTPITLNYSVDNAALAESSYDLAVEADTGFTVNGTTVTAQFSEADTYTATITYTHKVDTQYKKTIVYKLSVVDDVENAPKFVGDPFGGTFDTLVPNVGLMLYSSATNKDGGAITSVNYELVGSASGISVRHIANNTAYPFYIVASNANTSSFKVKMTVSDGSYTAVSIKTFSVKEIGKNKDYADMAEYGANFNVGDLDYSNTHSDMYSKLCLTKTGFVAFPANGNSSALASGHGDMGCVMVNGPDNFQVDFKMTFYAHNTVGGKSNTTSLSLGFRTVNHDGWAGNIAIKDIGSNKFDAYGWLSESNDYKTAIDYSLGDTFYFRLKHEVSGSNVKYTVYCSTTGQEGSYTEMYNTTCANANSAGNGGAPVYMMQFGYEAGCFAVEDVVLTDLG